MMIDWTDLRDRERGKEGDQKDKIILGTEKWEREWGSR